MITKHLQNSAPADTKQEKNHAYEWEINKYFWYI